MTDEKSHWYPFGCHRSETADYKGIDKQQQKWLRLSDRVTELFNDELASLHLIIWDQPNDADNDEAGSYVEICAFGGDGSAADRNLADWIDRSLQGHIERHWYSQGRDELAALKDLHGRIGAMIAEREAARDKLSEEIERAKDGTDKA